MMYFRSNLDLSPAERWPIDLPHRPMVGDYVVSSHMWSTPNGVRQLRLMVVGITWAWREKDWICVVEMNLPTPICPWKNLSQFIHWYDFVQGKISLKTYQERCDVPV